MMKRFQHYHCFSFVNQRRSCQWKLLSLLILWFCSIKLTYCSKFSVSIVIFVISLYKISLMSHCSPVSFILMHLHFFYLFTQRVVYFCMLEVCLSFPLFLVFAITILVIKILRAFSHLIRQRRQLFCSCILTREHPKLTFYHLFSSFSLLFYYTSQMLTTG